ncbi:MAG: 30S ribosomal protein S21 [Clostridia bacterium]|nr:30S ribosomal protein S21 [Clostridia bacterium]
MSSIRVGDNESLENALKRFKRKCQKDNIMGDLRRKEQYEKPSVRRKKKAEAARKRIKN